MTKLIFICVYFLTWLCINESARILGIFPSAGYSQYILASTLMKEVAARGHEVTVISPFALKPPVPNYKDVTAASLVNIRGNENMFDLESLSIFTSTMAKYGSFGVLLTERTLQDEKVQELLLSDATFDLVISEIFFNEAHMGFAHHYQAPLIVFSSLGSSEWSNHLVANPAPFSHVPMLFTSFSDCMNFWQRLQNTFIGLFDIIYRHSCVFPKQNEILKKYFPGAPHIKDIMYNASLILLNSHVAMNFPAPHVPSMVEIGGFHVSPKPLSKDLQDYLDNARDGAIYFSMGSNLKSKDLPKAKIDDILRTFVKLKQKVLWKWEDEDLPGKPSNVKVGKWLPQQDILAHPNIRVFISHGGLLGTTEAVYNGVPMICIPIFGDQKMNTETAVLNGYAIKISFPNLNEESLSWALKEVLTNTSYREIAQKRSRILKDQPVKPMDKAIFWIEYVLRHQGAPHLRSAALSLHWYQYFLLDVVAFILVVVISIVLLCRALIRKVFRFNKQKRRGKEKQN